jgi:hypothetical protein
LSVGNILALAGSVPDGILVVGERHWLNACCRPFAVAIAGRFIRSEPFEARLAQQSVLRPFAESDFSHELRLDPVDR